MGKGQKKKTTMSLSDFNGPLAACQSDLPTAPRDE